jgi:hypothetical protein
MDVKRRQHLLPENYLKHWIDPATIGQNKTPMVWAISKDATRRQPKPLASGHFWREYFYDLISTTGERRQARIVAKQIVHKQQLGRDEVEVVDLFVACLFMRTERMK